MTDRDVASSRSEVVYLNDQQRTLEVVGQSVLGLWDVVNNLTRLRLQHRSDYRVTIFGSARVQPDHWVYAAVRDMAAELARMGCTIITGGGPGLMQAANEGAATARAPMATATALRARTIARSLPAEGHYRGPCKTLVDSNLWRSWYTQMKNVAAFIFAAEHHLKM